MLHQFLVDGNSNMWELNGDYKHFTALMAVLGAYITKVAYIHVTRAAGMLQVSPVANKLLALLGN